MTVSWSLGSHQRISSTGAGRSDVPASAPTADANEKPITIGIAKPKSFRHPAQGGTLATQHPPFSGLIVSLGSKNRHRERELTLFSSHSRETRRPTVANSPLGETELGI